MQESQQAFERALQHHQAGRLDEAEQGYRDLLRADPAHADAMHLLGMLLNQRGESASALPLLQQAISLRADYPPLYLNLGVVLFGLGRIGDAAAAYRQALALRPDYAEAHNSLGYAEYRLGRSDAALASLSAAIAIRPDFAEAHNHLGIVQQALGNANAAAASFRRAIELNPRFAQAHDNLGLALVSQGEAEPAMHCFRRALALDPAHVDAHNNLGIALFSIGRIAEAIASYRALLAAQPGHPAAMHNLAGALQAQGKYTEALACYREVLALQPGNEVARHMVAAIEGRDAPRAPDGYVARVFDEYADTFDSHLQSALKYAIPGELPALLTPYLPPSSGGWDIFDLGCGTGLVGEAFQGRTRSLTGVDLSPKMLAKARARGCYTRLIEAELLAAMRAEPAASQDLIAAADVFVYVGRLDEIAAEARRMLRPGGLFAFSVESVDESHAQAGYKLEQTGRYRHTAGYLEQLAARSGLRALRMVEVRVRVENGVPANGWIVLWQA